MKRINLHLSDEMAEQLQQDARSQGMSKSAFLRHLYLVWRQFLSERDEQVRGEND